ncbi:pseudouridine synthase [Aureimonas pseudogalii]|uniref:Pseudouridine synthase n=1 Tax=Aureimonas pseudogalii TaxID=1744844 RepID=A0A7W6E8D9_9HYPH|nr:pseudouridine synthase [Aureimonas pseudogalii]MBB3996637.1 23S rRNA pseudouridine2605 synthase [Aureimonas pseudogalii]
MSDTNDGGRRGGGKGGPRSGGGKSGGGGARGGAGGGDRPRGGKPAFGGAKPGGAGAGKPFRSRPAGAAGAPRGDGERSFRPRTERSEGERKPFVKREGAGGGEGRTFRPRTERTEGARKPFVKHEGGGAGEGRTFRPRTERGDGERKPFVKREGGERGAGTSERKPFVKRDGEAGERKPFRARTERPEGERKPFVKREDGGERGSYRRPEGAERPARQGGDKPFTPRSHGMFSHGGARTEGGEARPRSYGRLQHGDVAGEARKPREFKQRSGGSDRAERPRRESRRESRTEAGERPARREGGETASDGSMRIAKRLARAGVASRRDAEGMIADGRITLNGRKLDTPAVDVTMRDRIEVDGKPLPAIERTRLWLFHKPAGLVTTNRDPEGRTTVFDRLPEDMPRVLSIGRLDINTEGLLLLTNDGGLARVLELPATGWLRRYRVRARGEVTQAQLDELRQGIAVDGVFYGAIEATLDREQGSNVWLTLGLREGKNREVKRVLGHLGLDVNRLIRLSFGPFQLGDLAEGAVQEIKGRMLRDQLGERLIEESGADFDAPIVNEFTNQAVVAPKRTEASEDRSERGAKPKREWISATDSTPNRKKFGAAKRDDALGRLDTKAPRSFRDKPDGGERGGRTFEKRERPAFGGGRDKPTFGDKPRRPNDRPNDRTGEAGGDARATRRPALNEPKRSTNVWMAPGARAVGEAKKAERDEKAKRFPRTGERTGGFGARGGERSGSDRPRGDRPHGDRPQGDRPRGGGGGRGPKG